MDTSKLSNKNGSEQCGFQSVRKRIEQDTEPLAASDEQVASLHGDLHHRCVNV